MITPEIYKGLGLDDFAYKRILSLLGREPTFTELAMFSVEWSEHCGYCHSRQWLKLLPKKGPFKVLVGEDSGGIVIDGLAVVFKAESHNHPSQVEPKQGAATGIGGILRDIFTAGARPVALLDSLRFGPLSDSYSRYLLKGVVDGIQSYGNCVGVPTVGGEIYFNESYKGNCLVNVMCVGLAPESNLMRAKASAGNSIMYVGSATGRDGIGGCSVLASAEFSEGEEKRPSVQIGDPFTEKCLIEATLEIINSGYVLGIKDMGAAGLTCSISEMALAGDAGMDIDLDKVPLREKGMQAWEIMMSESQERMLVCVKAGKEPDIEKIFAKWQLNAAVLGKATGDGIIRIKSGGKPIVEVKAEFLAEAPMYEVKGKKPEGIEELNRLDMKSLPVSGKFNEELLTLLSSPNVASKQQVYEQYDHMVGVDTVSLPGSDSAVVRIKGIEKGLAITTDCPSKYCFLDPFRGSQIAVAEAVRNLVCSGAKPAGLTDCLNFGNPERPDRYWYFERCAEGIISACEAFNIPVVSGNVSFYNESPEGQIYPTPMIGMVGIIDDINKTCTQEFKREGDIIILLGENKDELGGSEWLERAHNLVKGPVPSIDLEKEAALEKTVLEIIDKGLVHSAHDCSEGGLAVALAECCVSGRDRMTGAVIAGLDFNMRKDAVLFGEAQSRIVVSCPVESVEEVKRIAKRNNAPFRVIGRTGGDALKILDSGKYIINLKLDNVRNVWSNSLAEYLAVGK